ncbi:Sds3-like-domain-containing protein [Chytriomyces sp. MP71]|nr:Sds3-like-domain-containing protein [Chytriomyces sp. MP71]
MEDPHHHHHHQHLHHLHLHPPSEGSHGLVTKKERRHREFVERVDLIGREFAEAKERIYFEKLAAFKQELRDVQDGTHHEFEERVAILEFERSAAIRRAELFRNYQIETANSMYQAEKEAYDQEYLAEKQGLRDKILAQLEERRKKLKEDRENFDMTQGKFHHRTKESSLTKRVRSEACKSSIKCYHECPLYFPLTGLHIERIDSFATLHHNFSGPTTKHGIVLNPQKSQLTHKRQCSRARPPARKPQSNPTTKGTAQSSKQKEKEPPAPRCP